VALAPPWVIDRVVLRRMRLGVGGTVAAARMALEGGACVNLSGGYHHASSDEGGGFCVYADVPIAVATLQLGRVLIVDLDAHQGNGFERALGDRSDVAFLDMYNRQIYPRDDEARRAIRWEVPLRAGAADGEYLERLGQVLPQALDEFKPDFAFYIAGTDIYEQDPLGSLAVSAEGVFQRDRFVFEELFKRGVPWVMVLGGGYTLESHRLVARSVASLFDR
jgi:histone deacetylase 11